MRQAADSIREDETMSVRGVLATLIAGCFIGLLALDAHAVATKTVKVGIANAGPRASVTVKATDGSFQKTQEVTEDSDHKIAAYFELDTDKTYDVEVLTANGTFYDIRNQRLSGEVALDTKTMTQHGDPTAIRSSRLISKATVNRFFPKWMQKDAMPGAAWEARVFAGWGWADLLGLRGGGGAAALGGEIEGVTLKNGPKFGADVAYWWPSGLGFRVGYEHFNNHIKQGPHMIGSSSGTNPGATITGDILNFTPMIRCTCFVFDPYIGAGLLVARTSISQGQSNQTEGVFGWQAVAGGTYHFTKILGLFVEGRYNRFAYDNAHMNLGGSLTDFPADATISQAQVLVGFSAQFDAGSLMTH
jgi:hypothetical protein